jgi:hypothetical protein
MATMRLEPAALLTAILTGLLSSAHGQKLDIKPGVDVLMTATTNGSNSATAPRKDLVISVAPEISVAHTGAHSHIEGRLKVESLHYVRDSQPDLTLPSGELLLRTDVVEQWAGLDATVQTRQTPASPLTVPNSAGTTTNGYTTTQALIAPFIDHAFNADTKLKARLERSVTQSSEIITGPTGPGKRGDSNLSRHSARLERQPVPLGASVEWTYLDAQDAGQTASTLKESAVRASVSYALNDQVHTGLILGRESTRVPGAEQSDAIRGMNLVWRPNERATLDATVERRFFGTGWKVDWNHRMRFFNWSVTSERDSSTYSSALTTPKVGPPVAPPVGAPVALLDEPYSLAASLRQTLQGRMVIMGIRNTVTFTGGLTKSQPLVLDTSAPAPAGDYNQERFLDAQFIRRLTPQTSLNAGVRWGMSNVTSTTAPSGRSRSVIWRGAINTRLSPQATASVGLRHQTNEGSQVTVSDESAMFVGLGYRY